PPPFPVSGKPEPGLVDKPDILQHGPDTYRLISDELAEFGAAEIVLGPTLGFQNLVPLLALVQLLEVLDPAPLIAVRHVGRAQYTTPVTHFHVIPGFLESRGINAGQPLWRRDTKDANASLLGELREFGHAGEPCHQRTIDDAGYGFSTAGLRNIVEIVDRHVAGLRQQRQCDLVHATGRTATNSRGAGVGLEGSHEFSQRLVW